MAFTGNIPGQNLPKPTPAGTLNFQHTGAAGIRMPTASPTVTMNSGGSVDAGSHVWAVAFLGPNGLTPAGPPSSAVTVTSGTQSAALSAIPTGPTGTTARYLYRSKAGTTAPLYLCGILGDNVTTTFTDTGYDADLGDPAFTFLAGDDWTQVEQLAANLLAGYMAQIGPSGTPLIQIAVYSPALTPAAVAANTTAEQTFTVNGLATNDKVFVNKPTAQAGLGIANARVSAANTLAITYLNATAGAITPTAETYTVVAIRS